MADQTPQDPAPLQDEEEVQNADAEEEVQNADADDEEDEEEDDVQTDDEEEDEEEEWSDLELDVIPPLNNPPTNTVRRLADRERTGFELHSRRAERASRIPRRGGRGPGTQ
ncbi:hypothetical protein LINPERHAP1_LOCUS35503 [Linum perenne]